MSANQPKGDTPAFQTICRGVFFRRTVCWLVAGGCCCYRFAPNAPKTPSPLKMPPPPQATRKAVGNSIAVRRNKIHPLLAEAPHAPGTATPAEAVSTARIMLKSGENLIVLQAKKVLSIPRNPVVPRRAPL